MMTICGLNRSVVALMRTICGLLALGQPGPASSSRGFRSRPSTSSFCGQVFGLIEDKLQPRPIRNFNSFARQILGVDLPSLQQAPGPEGNGHDVALRPYGGMIGRLAF